MTTDMPAPAFYDRFAPFAEWLATTGASQFVQNNFWVIPTIQTIHILAITTAVGAVLMLDLRIMGLAGRSQTMTDTARRFMPWLWWSVLVLLFTGVVMIVGEPTRELVNPAFWWKMGLLVASVLIAVAFQWTLKRNVAFWETSHERRQWTRVAALVALAGWIGIIILGRWIAYAQAEF